MLYYIAENDETREQQGMREQQGTRETRRLHNLHALNILHILHKKNTAFGGEGDYINYQRSNTNYIYYLHITIACVLHIY